MASKQSTAAVASNTNNDEDCKELEPFPFDDDSEGGGLDAAEMGDENMGGEGGLELDEPTTSSREVVTSGGGGGGGSGWNAEDMLATNESKYGYKSTYNSALPEYTIAVEKGDGVSEEEFRRREIEAERLAAEIESSVTYMNNIDKELSDNEEEEEAFSAVVRTAPSQPSASEINNNNQQINNNMSHGAGNYQVLNFSHYYSKKHVLDYFSKLNKSPKTRAFKK